MVFTIPIKTPCIIQSLSAISWRHGLLCGVENACKPALSRVKCLCLRLPRVVLHIDGLVQDYSNPIAKALKLLQSYTKPSMYYIRRVMYMPHVMVSFVFIDNSHFYRKASWLFTGMEVKWPQGMCPQIIDGFPYSKAHGANMGPTWVLSAPVGPQVGLMNLSIRVSARLQ